MLAADGPHGSLVKGESREMGRLCALLLFLSPSVALAALGGVKTVDPLQLTAGDNYTTLEEAISALNTEGVADGGVSIRIASGIYDLSAPLNEVASRQWGDLNASAGVKT
jgi:hypothetical protein